MICRRCGFANQGGDQFCGSCGSFLEWEGEAADAAAPATAAAPAGVSDEGLSGLVRPASVPVQPPAAAWTPAPPVAPLPPPVVPVPPAPAPARSANAPAADALLRCPACGIANAGSRTFCQSCGTRLADTARVTEVSREQIAAAVAASSRPRVAPVAGAARVRTEPAGGGSRGMAGWVIGMAVLGIVVGVGIVVASVLFKEPGPETGATALPGVTTSTGPGTSAGATSAPGASDAPTPGEPTTPAPTGKATAGPLPLTGAAASSVVGGLAKFAPDKAIDGNPRTCWQEGTQAEKGQWIEVSFAPSRVDAVVINNGYGASTALYKGNHRLKVVRISVDGGEPVEVTLKDTGKVQRIKLGGIPAATKLRITIVSVYPAVRTSVSGSPFDDAALSEVSVIGVPGG